MSSTLLSIHWKQAGFADGQIGWLAAGFSSAAIASRLGLGRGMERFGRRPFLIFGAALLTLLPAVYPYLGENYLNWAAVRLLQGVGLGCYLTTVLTWVADISPPEKVGALQGVFGVSGLVGSAAGPFVAEQTYLTYDFPAMFNLMLGEGVLCCLLVAMLPETRKKQSSATASKLNWRKHLDALVVSWPFGWFVGVVVTFIGPFLKEQQLPKVGLYFTGFAIASVGVRIFAAAAIDRTPIKRLVGGSGGLVALSGICISLLAIWPSVSLLIAAAVLNGLGHGFLFPGLSAHVVRKSSVESRGGGLALFTGVFDLGILMGALLSGYLSESFGYASIFAVSGGLMIMSLPVFWVMAEAKVSK